ncbi:Glycine N-acyltransferase-like protein 3 [Frankliniella fusca]|uniref:Glycine N-acyltransferase-like protein 3 n=1 Tax=Frankliniella fusca TaxID=407009 RepID=A0AAE1LN24_9NEOP|nr:Glycine N-acyltransferase-like protein 3 [Frankliniella fusca]
MAGHGDEPLRELVEDKQVECLLEALRKDLPHSIHIFNRISNHLRWRREGLVSGVGERGEAEVRVSVHRLAEEGDATDGPATVVSVMEVTGNELHVALHTTEPSCAALRRALASSAVIPWARPLLFESVHERCVPALLAEARARGDPDPKEYPTHKYMLPLEKCLALDTSDPSPELRLRPLEPRHAKIVNDNWPYGTPASENLLRETLKRNPGLSWGVFPGDQEDQHGDPEPVAFVMGQWFGGLGILHTMDSHRRRGLGAQVTRAAARAQAERHGLASHANIVFPNPASEATLGKGYVYDS